MKKYSWFLIFLLCTCFLNAAKNNWNIYLNFPNEKKQLIENVDFTKISNFSTTKKIHNYTVSLNIKKQDGYWIYRVDVSPKNLPTNCFISLSKNYSGEETPYCFYGRVKESTIFRQSPHEPADHEMTGLVMQPVPMVGIKKGNNFEIALSNSPVFYDNYTTQTFNLKRKFVSLATGDNGTVFNQNAEEIYIDSLKRRGTKKYIVEPHFFNVDTKNSHHLDGVFFTSAENEIGKLRERVNEIIAGNWSDGKITDLLGSTVFSTSYMNLRVNETKKSKFWVIPAIEYANKQYTRDAFWISMVLPDTFSLSCYENEAENNEKFTGAERQIFTIVWAYRNYLKGLPVDTSNVRKILRIVEKKAPGGYYSGFGPSRKAGCWQGWADNLAFDETDAISNNQGLYVVALKCAEKMGVKPQSSITQALKNYQDMYQPRIKGFAISKEKDSILCVDALMGDLLAQVYLGERLLPEKSVLSHYETMKRFAKTKVGFKTFCNPDGSYLKPEQYNSKKYTAAVDKIENGLYQFGGSWYLYDMQMLMDAYLAGASDAEDLMIWRTKLEFEKGNTTHEYINTTTGQPSKPNMGWNAGIYGLWNELIKQGKATDRFFKEVDKLK